MKPNFTLPKDIKRKKIGVVLPGGGTKVLFRELGALKAFEDYGLNPKVMVGYSAGALLGGYYCFYRDIPKLLQIASKINPIHYFNYSINNFLRFFLLDPRAGLLDHKKVVKKIREHIGSIKIEKLPINLIVTTTIVGTGKKCSLKKNRFI